MACANCCGTCCAVLQLAGFDHPVAAEMFAYFRQLGTGTTRNVNSFEFSTNRQLLPDGTWVRASGTVFWSSGPSVQLVIRVASPYEYSTTRGKPALLYWDRFYSYTYRVTDQTLQKIINPCTHSLLAFRAEDCISIQAGNGQGLVADAIDVNYKPGVGQGPSVPVPQSAGLFRVGMAKEDDNSPLLVDGDNYAHNIEEVVLEVFTEIVGDKTTLTPATSGNPITLTIDPVSFEFGLQKSSTVAGLYQFNSTFDHSPYKVISNGSPTTTSSVNVAVQFYGSPNCANSGQLFVAMARGIVPVAAITRDESGSWNDVFAATYNPMLMKTGDLFNVSGDSSDSRASHLSRLTHEADAADSYSGNLYYGSNPSQGPYNFTVVAHSYGDRMKKCASPPCDPFDALDTDSVGRIFADNLPLTLSPQAPFLFPNGWQGRIYGGNNALGPYQIDSSEYVTIRLNARILSMS